MKIKTTFPSLIRILGLAGLASFSPAGAATSTWDGGGTDGNWSTAANWDLDTLPASGSTLVFDGSTQTTNTVDVSTSQNGLSWTGSSTWTVNNSGGAVVTLATGTDGAPKISNQSTGLVTINAPVTFSNNGEIATGGDITISGKISGSVALTKTGAGTLTLGNTTNAFSSLAIGAGTVIAPAAGSALGTGSVSIASGTTLQLNASGITTVARTFTGTGLLKLVFAAEGGTPYTSMNGVTGFNGTIELANTGANGNRWYVNNIGTLPSALVIDSGSQFYVQGGTQSFSQGVTVSGTGNTDGYGAIRLSGTLAGAVTLAGNTSVGANGGSLSATVAGTATAGNTQTLTVGTTSGTGSATLSGVISNGTAGGNVALAIGTVNMGDVTISGTNTYSGGTTVNFGRVVATNSSAFGTGTVTVVGDGTAGDGQVDAEAGTFANNFTISGYGGNTVDPVQRGALRLGNNSEITGNVTLAGNASIGVVGTGTKGTVSGGISGGYSLRKSETGTLVLSGTNTYTGTTEVTGGTLVVNGSTAAASAVSVASGTALQGSGTVNGSLALTGTLAPGRNGDGADRSLMIAGNVSAVSGSTVAFTIDSETAYDQLGIGGGSTIDLANASLQVTLNDTTFSTLAAGGGTNFTTDPAASGATYYELIAGASTGMFANVTTVMSSDNLTRYGLAGTQYTFTQGGQPFWVAQGGGSTYLVAIPETSSAMLLGLGSLGLALRRRRS